jgi:hypothetical protein
MSNADDLAKASKRSDEVVDHSIRLRLTKVDEYQFLTCVKHGLWGSQSDRFKSWQVGDLLVILVGKYLAGMGRVAGSRFKATDTVWDNGLFPHRVPILFEVVLRPDHRPPILGDIRDSLAAAFPSGGYGLGILNQLLVPEKAAGTIVGAMRAAHNDIDAVSQQIEPLLSDAKALRKPKRQPPKPPRAAASVPDAPTSPTVTVEAPLDHTTSTAAEERRHTTIEGQLVELGLMAGCSVWVATGDCSQLYQGKPLGNQTMPTLPNIGLGVEAMQRIARIDVIWFKNGTPLYAFEVEATTAVYSGLLRLSDLLALVPMLKLKLLIVAPTARQDTVLRELVRPTFDKIGLRDYCAFVPAEELEALVKRVSGLRGHLQPTIIETIQVEAPSQLTEESN